MMAPCSRSSTGILLWMAANMVDPPEGAPPLRQAFSLTGYSSVSLISPCWMAWKTTSAVISFIMLDGALSSSAFFSNSTLPLDASIRIAVGASSSKPPSSFLAPCTLLLAAYTMPLHPTAAATTAAIRLRQARPVAGPDLRDNSAAIDDALRSAFQQLEVMQTTRVLQAVAGPIRLRRRSNEPIVSRIISLHKISQTRRK